MSLQAKIRLPSEVPTPEVESGPPFGLVTVKRYQKQHPEVFPSPHAARWYCRLHRDELVAGEALFKWRGELCLDPPKFEVVAKKIMRASVTQSVGAPHRRQARGQQ